MIAVQCTFERTVSETLDTHKVVAGVVVRNNNHERQAVAHDTGHSHIELHGGNDSHFGANAAVVKGSLQVGHKLPASRT